MPPPGPAPAPAQGEPPSAQTNDSLDRLALEPASILRQVQESHDERAKRLIETGASGEPSVRPVTQKPQVLRSLVDLADSNILTSSKDFRPEDGAARLSDVSPSIESSELLKSIGRYEILRPLGSGGMGKVYLAKDPMLERFVAVKMISVAISDHRDAQTRFYREALALARLEHRNICHVYDIGDHYGQPYIVMRYIDGFSLGSLLKTNRLLPVKDAIAIVRKVAEGVAFAHSQGIIHRDLKPSNIMIDHRGEPVIMDFGLALSIDTQKASRITDHGAILGTPAYMSPEQCAGDIGGIGPATDVYGLGTILYEVLTGDLPFHGRVIEVLYQIVHSAPTPPSQLRPEVPIALDAICMRCLAKAPRDRFATARELADALQVVSEDKLYE